MKDIVITGSIAFDYVMHFPGKFTDHILPDSLDHISLSFLVDDMTRHWGGTGPNIAYTLGLLGEQPKLVASAGKDFGEYAKRLAKIGVDVTTVEVYEDIFSASFFANTDQANNQISTFYAGAMNRATELTLAKQVGGKADMVVIAPNAIDAMNSYVAECHALKLPYMYDVGQQVIRIEADKLREGIQGAAFVIVNAYEYQLLQDKTGLDHAAISAAAETVIVTRGEDGASIYTNGEAIEIPPAPVDEVADPTGAGDAFRGGYLKAWAEGWSPELAGRVGALAGAWTLAGRGPQSHSFTPAEFTERFAAAFPDFDSSLLNGMR